MYFKIQNSSECTEGVYGFNCSRQCKGHCRETIPCNHVTGMCDEGCAAGWAGMFCEEGILNC